MEEGQWSEPKTGTPQGSVISPLLANVYLHYAFDLWADVWRKKWAQGEVVVVRFADDSVPRVRKAERLSSAQLLN
jgi:retron-type reverse transcriptase